MECNLLFCFHIIQILKILHPIFSYILISHCQLSSFIYSYFFPSHHEPYLLLSQTVFYSLLNVNKSFFQTFNVSLFTRMYTAFTLHSTIRFWVLSSHPYRVTLFLPYQPPSVSPPPHLLTTNDFIPFYYLILKSPLISLHVMLFSQRLTPHLSSLFISFFLFVHVPVNLTLHINRKLFEVRCKRSVTDFTSQKNLAYLSTNTRSTLL